jgi:hypothetical protein
MGVSPFKKKSAGRVPASREYKEMCAGVWGMCHQAEKMSGNLCTKGKTLFTQANHFFDFA